MSKIREALRRFKFALCKDRNFNHTVFSNLLYIKLKLILHVVDKATRYEAARWLPHIAPEDVWHAMRFCCIEVYLGPWDVITHDAGKQLVSKGSEQTPNVFTWIQNSYLLSRQPRCIMSRATKITPSCLQHCRRWGTQIRCWDHTSNCS